MGHVNNGVYLDWLDEAVAAAGGADDVRAAGAALPRRVPACGGTRRGPPLRRLARRPGWAWRLADDAGDLLRGRLDPPGAILDTVQRSSNDKIE